MTAVAEEACCRFCFEGGVLEAPCECDGTLKFVHLCCLHRWQAEQMLRGGGLVGDSRATRCQVCKALYTTRPPQASELLALVRGREGASLAALIRPGCLLVARDAVLDESTLARAPAWLRWEISRKRRHWHRAVFLLTRVDDAGSDYGDDIIIGVNITRVRSESDDIEERREFKPEDAEGLTSSDSDSDSASDPRRTAPRRRRRRLHESSDNSSESIGPDGPIHSPPRPHVTIDEEDSDVDLNTPTFRRRRRTSQARVASGAPRLERRGRRPLPSDRDDTLIARRRRRQARRWIRHGAGLSSTSTSGGCARG